MTSTNSSNAIDDQLNSRAEQIASFGKTQSIQGEFVQPNSSPWQVIPNMSFSFTDPCPTFNSGQPQSFFPPSNVRALDEGSEGARETSFARTWSDQQMDNKHPFCPTTPYMASSPSFGSWNNPDVNSWRGCTLTANAPDFAW